MRSRNLKAGTYGNPILNRLPADHRWLFMGLGPIADRRGLVEDRPMKIADTVMRGLDTDVNAALETLATMKDDDGSTLISRYVGANGVRVIRINKFLQHNSPHRDEPENPTLCDPDGNPGKARGKHGACTVHAPDMHHTRTLLTPDCLTADCLTPDCGLLTEDCPPAEGCPESFALSAPAAPPAVMIPVREGEEPIHQHEVDTWASLYGNIDVPATLNRMRGHWLSKPANQRKTRRGIRTSINTWLAKDHDRASVAKTGTAASGVAAYGIDGRAARNKAVMAELLAEIDGGPNAGNN